MIADVPLGAFLSGGVDSSLIVSIMQSISPQPVRTFTIGFTEPKYDESRYAREVARHLGTDHTEMYVTPQMALSLVPKLGTFYAEPFADSSQIPTFLVCELARQNVTVALSGDAGDELFGGYRRYSYNEQLWSVIEKIGLGSRRNLSKLLRYAGDSIKRLAALPVPSMSKLANKLLVSSRMVPCRTFGSMYKEILSHHTEPSLMIADDCFEYKSKLDLVEEFNFCPTNYERMMLADLVTYLPDDILVKVDRAAMAVSLETRIPLLDHSIVEFSFQVPIQYKINNGVGKSLLRNLLYKYVPSRLIERPKRGFSAPIGAWLKSELKDWAWELIKSDRLINEGFLNSDIVSEFWEDHQTGRRVCDYILWDVLMFQSWYEEWQR